MEKKITQMDNTDTHITGVDQLVEFTVQNDNGFLVVDSRIVADMIDKRHNDLLRDIEKYIEMMKKSQNSKLLSDDFFIESSYNSGTGKNYKNYLLTRKGYEFLTIRMTGEKGTLIGLSLINKFKEAEEDYNNKIQFFREVRAVEDEPKIKETEHRVINVPETSNSLEIALLDERKVLGKQFKVYGTPEEPLFLAKDVAEWIGYDSSSINKMLNTVDEDEKLIGTIFRSGQNREMWCLTENGFYEVLMQSRKPIAKPFKKQVKLILKEIRMTGKYEVTPQIKVPTTMKEVLCIALEQEEKIERLKIENKKLEPHANFSKEFLRSKGTVKVGILAKHLCKLGVPIGRNRLFKYLKQHKYISYDDGYNIPTQKSINLGIMELEEKLFYDKEGNLKNGRVTKITPKGMKYFYRKLSAKKIVSA